MPTISLLDLKLKVIKNYLNRIPIDAFFKNVTLLLHGNGSNGAQNNTFLDSSTNNFAITRNGNTTQGTFSPYGSNWSNYFDGSGDFLSIPDNAAFDFGTGDFTIEAWVYIAGNSTTDAGGLRTATVMGAFQSSGSPITTSYGFTINGNTTTTGTGLSFSLWQSGVNHVITATTTITQNAWHHVAVARSGTATKLFLDGSEVGSGTLGNQNVDTAFPITIGRIAYTGYLNELNGYISNLRVLKGTAQYTGTYTVPTAPLIAITNTSLLTCQSHRFRDASTNNFTITRNGDVSVQRFSPFSPTAAYAAGTIGGSGYFDGSGDYLVVPSGAFSYTSGTAYTFECWIYPTSYPIQYPTILTANVSSGSNTVSMYIENNGSCGFGQANVGTVVVAPAGSIRLGCWNHIAVGKNSSNSVRMWVNGVSVATGTDTNNYAVGAVRVGLNGANANPFAGYIGDFRSVAGSDVYGYNNTTITVPAGPLLTVTNTSLLLNFTNAAIFDNAMMAVPETMGNAQIDTTTKKFGTGSLEFDGNGDYLRVRTSPELDLVTGNFTIEFWVYLNSLSSGNRTVLSKDGVSGSSYAQYALRFNTNGTLTATIGSGNGISYNQAFTSTTAFSTATWYHVALVRSGTTVSLYVNGTSEASATQTGTMTTGNKALLIGWEESQPLDHYLDGYIDDLRITKGVARYTTNFTPPTEQFLDI